MCLVYLRKCRGRQGSPHFRACPAGRPVPPSRLPREHKAAGQACHISGVPMGSGCSAPRPTPCCAGSQHSPARQNLLLPLGLTNTLQHSGPGHSSRSSTGAQPGRSQPLGGAQEPEPRVCGCHSEQPLVPPFGLAALAPKAEVHSGQLKCKVTVKPFQGAPWIWSRVAPGDPAGGSVACPPHACLRGTLLPQSFCFPQRLLSPFSTTVSLITPDLRD